MQFVLLALALTVSASALEANLRGTADSVGRGSGTNAVNIATLLASKKKRDTMQRIEDLEKWEDSGMALTLHSSMAASDLQTLSDGISEETYDQMLHKIADLGSRFVLHRGNRLAEDFVAQVFEEAGLEVTKDKWEYSGEGASLIQAGGQMEQTAELNNVVGFKKGSDLAHETIVIGAHLDSVNWKSGTDVAAPGIDDNASGLAAVLLLAKALAKIETRRNIALIAFNAEEEGLLGSKHFVKVGRNAYPWGEGISAALIADEIAFPGRPGRERSAIFETSGKTEANRAVVDTMAHTVADGQGALANFEVNYHGFGSDHMSFLNAGIPAVLLIERDDEWHADAVGHSSQDTFDGLSMDFGATMTRLLLRSAVHLAHPE